MPVRILAFCMLTSISGAVVLAQTSGTSGEQSKAADQAYSEAYDKAFRTAFRVKSVNQCVASATKVAAAGYDMTPTCVCMTDNLLATKSVQELAKLSESADKDSAEIREVAGQCLKSDPPWPVGNQGTTPSSK